jgi:hypothetical protein
MIEGLCFKIKVTSLNSPNTEKNYDGDGGDEICIPFVSHETLLKMWKVRVHYDLKSMVFWNVTPCSEKYVPPKRWALSKVQGDTIQETLLFIVSAVRTSNRTW